MLFFNIFLINPHFSVMREKMSRFFIKELSVQFTKIESFYASVNRRRLMYCLLVQI